MDGSVEQRRERLFERQGVRDRRVRAAMARVPREQFVPEGWAAEAYADAPLPIGLHQTISQPYIVGLMTERSRAGPGSRVLEIGTGSGYQAAVLAELGAEVWSVEILGALAEQARERLTRLGYAARVHVRHGDGARGWPEHAPYDAILVTAAPPRVPEALLEQLAPGGRLVAPVGSVDQQLVVLTRTPTGVEREVVAAVRFVPMTGEVRGA